MAALLLSSLVPAVAAAQEAPSPGPEVCLPLDAHHAILLDLRELQGKDGKGGLRQRVKLLDEKIVLQAEQLTDLTLAKDRAVQAKQAIQKSLVAAIRGQRKAEEARDAWYRSPVLWFGAGVVGALAIAVVVDKIQE
jgi:predicted RNase H-like nuclease